MDKKVYERDLKTATERESDSIACGTLRALNGKSADQLLKECGQETFLSVDLDAIIKASGVKIIPTTFEKLEQSDKYKHMGEISGLVLTNGDDVGIFYNKNDGEHRKKFTIAHELAHCCLHADALADGYVEFRSNATSSETREVAASTFAGELLIPEPNLRYALNLLLEPSLVGLAKIFDVSVSVMRARMKYLGIKYKDDSKDIRLGDIYE